MAEINIRKSILQYRNPEIVLDELSVVDTSSQEGDRDLNDQKSNNIQKKYMGMAEPLIRINSVLISGLSYFKLDLTGFKPMVFFRFQTIDERFISTSYPKDGDVFCVYIRALGEMFKPIRMDFIITEVISPFSKTNNIEERTDNLSSASGRYQTYIITGEAKIPKLYKDISKVFKGRSTEALIKIAEDLQLGYASNEEKTNDTMNWISPNTDYETLIKNISTSAWLGEEDYFDCWIDQYYNINLVNLKKQFDDQNSTIETMRMAYGADTFGDTMAAGTETMEVEFPILLTNSVNHTKSPLYIRSISLEHNAGQINNDLGYFQNVQFYDSKLQSDKPKNKFVEYPIESVTNKNLGSRDTLNKGRLGEEIYKEEIKKTYVGTMYFENVHENFHQAQIQNIFNKNDSYKLLLKVKTKSWTPFLYRGQNIPVIINNEGSTTNSADSKYTPASGDKTNQSGDPEKSAPNYFLSGNYVILGVTVEYSPKEGIYQTVTLGKKQWALNPGMASDPETVGDYNNPPGFNQLVENSSTTLQQSTGRMKEDVFSK